MVQSKELQWPYFYSQSGEHAQVIGQLQKSLQQDLDCSGDDAGKAECWPPLVNIGVPILCCAIFLVVILVIYVTYKPKQSTLNSEKQKEEIPSVSSQNYEKHLGVSTETMNQSDVVSPIASTQTINTCISMDTDEQTDTIKTQF